MVRETKLSCIGCEAETNRASDHRNIAGNSSGTIICFVHWSCSTILRMWGSWWSSSNLIGLHYMLQCVQVNSANVTRPLPRMQSGWQRQTIY